MAKKRSGSGDLNVSGAIRDLLTEQPNLTGRECLDVVKAKYPGASINEKSFQVAYSVIRGKLGLGRNRKKVRRKKPGAAAVAPQAAVRTSSAVNVSIEQLQMAREFVTKIGGAKAATAAIEQLSKLQIQ